MVAVGAALGGVARLLLSQAVGLRFGQQNVPYATLAINVSGSFLIGVVIELATGKAGLDPLARAFLATGLLGGYTTFSTFSYEVLALAGGGFPLAALGYATASVVLGVLAAWAGAGATRALA